MRRAAAKSVIIAFVALLGSLVSATGHAHDPLGTPSLAAGQDVRREFGLVNGLHVHRYTWRDSRVRPRSASLVRHGEILNGQPRGGYTNQFTFQRQTATGAWRTVFIDPPVGRSDAGFGYFVSHENYRYFDADVCGDGSNNCTIASLHGEDDSPLGHRLPGTGRAVFLTAAGAAHEFTLNYPHWGTTVPVTDPSNPADTTPSDFAQHVKYDLPVRIRWTFTAGQDYPLWSVTYDLSAALVNRLSVDVRGPYGVMIFDGSDRPLRKVQWGDRYKFSTIGADVTTQSEWAWDQVNRGARYNLLLAGDYEFGLVQTVPYRDSRTGSPWSDMRGSTSAVAGPGCADAGWQMPCDWMWTYQSIQYEAFDDTPTSAKKLAWGSAAYIGTSKTTDDNGQPFRGYPVVSYKVWITFDRTSGVATRALADSIR